MKFIFTISLIIITSSNSFGQLNFGFDITQTTNKFIESNLIVPVSNKMIMYLNYKLKNSVVELYYGEDNLTTSNIQLNYNEYGIIFGAYKKYKSNGNFYPGIGFYNRIYSNGNNYLNFGNKVGVTGKIQFGLEITEGLNTGITYRYFQDLFNLNENQNQLLLYQSSFCFTMEINLFRAYTIIINKIKKRKEI